MIILYGEAWFMESTVMLFEGWWRMKNRGLRWSLEGAHRMGAVFLCLSIIFAHSICFPIDPDSGYGTNIAVEFMVNGKSYRPPIVGHLRYTGYSIDVVSIFEGGAGTGIYTQAEVYLLVERTVVSKGVHLIKGKNQYGAIASGTIDFRDQAKPRITFETQAGVVITNISSEGKEWQAKHIPNIVLGQ